MGHRKIRGVGWERVGWLQVFYFVLKKMLDSYSSSNRPVGMPGGVGCQQPESRLRKKKGRFRTKRRSSAKHYSA